MRLDDIAIPASPAARMAHEVAAAYCSYRGQPPGRPRPRVTTAAATTPG
ncbi:hypothetical protein [Sphaerisporangium album]|nr:hypothetical protein [Sphaerisporangium album]